MNKMIKILSAVLVVQVIVIVITYSTGTNLEAYSASELFLDLKLSALDEVQIEKRENDELSALIIKKKDNKWFLPEHYEFPITEKKLTELTDNLFKVKRTWPVATTEVASKQLKLAEDNFENKITFRKDDKDLKVLFLGSSPGFKKVHARLSDETNSYAIDFSTHEASHKPVDWYDKTYANFDREQLVQLDMPAYSIKKIDKEYALDGIGADQEPKKDKVNDVVVKLSSLHFSDILGTEAQPEYNQDNPDHKYTVTLKDDKKIDYAISKHKDDDYLVLKMSTEPYYFKINEAIVESVFNRKLEDLVQKKKEEDKKEESKEADEATEEKQSEPAKQ